MSEDAQYAADDGEIPQPLQRRLPKLDRPGNTWVLRQAAVGFRIGGVMKHVDDVRPAHSCRVVDPGIGEAGIIAKLSGPSFSELFHFRFGAKVEAARWTRLDARGLEPLSDAVHAQRALENFAGCRTELRNVEGAAAHAVAAADAFVLLEVHDPVDILDDGSIGGTCHQAPRLLAVHALVLAHQKLQGAIFALVLVELDQVPVVPLCFRHRLVGIVERRFAKREPVPFQAGHLAGLASDAGGGVNQFANVEFPPDAGAGGRSGVC